MTTTFVIPKTDGTNVITDAAGIFPGGIAPTISRYDGIEEQAPATNEQKVRLRYIQESTEIEKFIHRVMKFRNLRITQHQLVEQIRIHREKLSLNTCVIFAVIEIRGDDYLFQVWNSVPGEPAVTMTDLIVQKVWRKKGTKSYLIVPF